MKQSKSTSTYLGLATGVGLAALWIGISISLRPDDEPRDQTPLVTSQRGKAYDPYDIRPSLIHFRDHELQKEVVLSDRNGPQQQAASSPRDLALLLKKLPDDLSEAELALLFDWLRAGPGTGSLPVSEYAHLANEVLNALHRQKVQPSGLAALVIELANHGQQPDLVRDYAVQHLRAVWNDLPNDSTDRDLIVGALWKEADARHPSRSGTALLALHHLGIEEGVIQEGERHVPDSEFESRLPTLLSRPDEPAASRITALRIVAERSLGSQVTSVRELVRDSSQNTVVRLRAIATLGSVGTADDVSHFNLLKEEPLLSEAVASALKKLTKDPS